MTSKKSSIGGIHTNSKKIKKTSIPKESKQTPKDSNSTKKYNTFDTSKRKLILSDVKKGIISSFKLKLEEEDLSIEDILEYIDDFDFDKYNTMLKKILSEHVDSFVCSTKVLTQWRKKIKSWINSSEKPETRGGLVVSPQRRSLFNERVTLILQHLPIRCFKTLKNKILELLEEFHNEDQDPANPTEFNPKTCSKHWWFNFMQKNQDIKQLWEDIPLERSLKKEKPDSQHSTEASEENISDVGMPHSSSPSQEDFIFSPAENLESDLGYTNGHLSTTDGTSGTQMFSPAYEGLDQVEVCIMEEEEKKPEIANHFDNTELESYNHVEQPSSPSRFLFEEDTEPVAANFFRTHYFCSEEPLFLGETKDEFCFLPNLQIL